MTPLLSVCIPTYNAQQYIGDTLRSIYNQNMEDYEIVVVDNASSDDTELVI